MGEEIRFVLMTALLDSSGRVQGYSKAFDAAPVYPFEVGRLELLVRYWRAG